jgi:hypothetical protein
MLTIVTGRKTVQWRVQLSVKGWRGAPADMYINSSGAQRFCIEMNEGPFSTCWVASHKRYELISNSHDESEEKDGAIGVEKQIWARAVAGELVVVE